MKLEDTYNFVVENSQSKSFYIGHRGLKTLVGQNIPDIVEGFFDCDHNNLTSLEGAPKYVGNFFGCSYNDLTSLQGSPRYVGRDFMCYENKLTSLEGLPEYLGGHVYCDDYLRKGENLYIIIASEIRGCYQGERDIDVMLHRIKSLFSK
jgi:hypothetical protein